MDERSITFEPYNGVTVSIIDDVVTIDGTATAGFFKRFYFYRNGVNGITSYRAYLISPQIAPSKITFQAEYISGIADIIVSDEFTSDMGVVADIHNASSNIVDDMHLELGNLTSGIKSKVINTKIGDTYDFRNISFAITCSKNTVFDNFKFKLKLWSTSEENYHIAIEDLEAVTSNYSLEPVKSEKISVAGNDYEVQLIKHPNNFFTMFNIPPTLYDIYNIRLSDTFVFSKNRADTNSSKVIIPKGKRVYIRYKKIAGDYRKRTGNNDGDLKLTIRGTGSSNAYIDGVSLLDAPDEQGYHTIDTVLTEDVGLIMLYSSKMAYAPATASNPLGAQITFFLSMEILDA